MTFIAHITTVETPYGLALFLAGIVVGSGLTYAAAWVSRARTNET